MAEAARRYGAIVGIFNGNEPVILVSGLEAIKEVSYREEFSGRPKTLIQKSDKGSYEKWKVQRRFTLRHLRDLGFGKQTLEEIVHEELLEIFSLVEKVSGGEKTGWPNLVTVHDVIGSSRINVLWCIVAGKRYSISDPFINEVLDCAVKLFRLCESGGGSIISKLFPFLGTFPRLMHYRKRVQTFLMEEIRKHKESLDSNSPRDFIDVYLTEMEKQKFNKQSTFEERQLVETCLDLFVAGSDSSFSLLVFSILFMVLYPDVQLQVQDEIDRIIGRDRLPSLSDKASLPYVEATMSEILRRSSVAPLGVPHAILGCSKDVKLQGYILPKDARVILNLYGLHHDPKIWGDPDNFRPERFLDENGKHIKHEALLPFGFGKTAVLFPEEWTQRTQGSKVGGAMDEGRPGYVITETFLAVRCLEGSTMQK
ncbi:hypothetical protein J437_LFUL001492 [Ladona fulva]|uniref:Cytochrome P450 n=1 Tax=Ladona fulva TaxID=123851 RepID=A0A8K0JW68_LADFU|nr:hypothetical protein J437_LFUL001492 [Ladona fulva]